MERYLSNGILASIFIEKRKDFSFKRDENFNLKKQIKKILKDINRIIDVSKYDIIEQKNSFILNLNFSFINDNIENLLKEIDDLTPSTYFFEKISDFNETMNIDNPDSKKKYPLFSITKNEKYNIKYSEQMLRDMLYFSDFHWILSDKYSFDNVIISGAIIPLWVDINKYIGESETPMLRLLNNMKVSYYHSELSKVLIYEIIG